MCGIALLISGVRIQRSSSSDHNNLEKPLLNNNSNFTFSIDDLKLALHRRGPDSLGYKKLIITANEFELESSLQFLAATLQLRGLHSITQPFVDSSNNVLIYNGEIFGGVHVGSDENDGEMLMKALENCCSCTSCDHRSDCSGNDSVLDVLSRIKGPWALVYWQDSSKTLWFGRDAFGRRSLLVRWPTVDDPRFMLSSVSPFSSVDGSSDFEVGESTDTNLWEELLCGIYSLSMDSSAVHGCLSGEVKKHEWPNDMLKELIKWERVSVEPKLEDLYFSCGPEQTTILVPAQNVLTALRKSLMLRTSLHKKNQAESSYSRNGELVPVAVLFSGGLDSMILAALLDECLDPSFGIDLLNVSFDGQFAPDRISSKTGVAELRRIAPLRRWNLVEIDADLSKLVLETKHVMSLINPANTYMDLNIGIALWLAASGYGWVSRGTSNSKDESEQRVRYESQARIVLVGSGADEQCAGYGRHRTKYRSGRGCNHLGRRQKLFAGT
ncbi:uncharacterized protein LOC126686946 isoform X2 [Mercurialis annua]|uniref:uncharacterized protein LOC126686946 isoform X2 n=1 Tax=Mercurialis annua TaxID=3986 RepID=UPI00215FB086|nr:uncharacterized protein LOC126686946 isoform X2 [Mercurialis annua]XP_050237211.1 uncharacterized protein LOC126686946 isoform X2 [Mercurialis annua]